MGAPSDRWVDLTIGASLTKYTAPANGYFATRVNNDSYLGIYNANSTAPEKEMMSSWITGVSYGSSMFCPIKKGQQIMLGYDATPVYFRFIYAEQTNACIKY